MRILVGDELVTLKAGEILEVAEQVPHAIEGGDGPIEHFGIRVPYVNDKELVGDRQRAALDNSLRLNQDLPEAFGQHVNLVNRGKAVDCSSEVITELSSGNVRIMHYWSQATSKPSEHLIEFFSPNCIWEARYCIVWQGKIVIGGERGLASVRAGQILEMRPGCSFSRVQFEGEIELVTLSLIAKPRF